MSSIHIEDLKRIHLLENLAPEILGHLCSRLELCRFDTGSAILRQGERPQALYFILRGRVRVVLTDEDGVRHHLASLGEGETFGERALLTGEARTADVLAQSEVSLAALGGEDFAALLPLCPQIYANLCRQLAGQLGDWALRHRREEQEHKEILNNLVGWQFLPEYEAFPGTSDWARWLNGRIDELSGAGCPVLILGEPGTWKDLCARLIHHRGGSEPRPILFLDCADPPPVLSEAAEGTAEPGGLLREIAQESALFGHEPDSSIYARGTRRGYLELADGGDLILAHIEHLAPRVQALLAAYLQTGVLVRRGEKKGRAARTRILATGTRTLASPATSGAFNPELLGAFSGGILMLRPLRERKKDIPGIARSQLGPASARHGKSVSRISHQALNTLVDYDWPLNGTELHQVIDRAVALCKTEELTVEHIHLQSHAPPEGLRFNLLDLPPAARLARHPLMPAGLRLLTIPLFLLVLLGTLLGPQQHNPANLSVWALWWPLLLAGAALCSRSWCSYCPIGALGEFPMFPRVAARQVPAWLLRHGSTLALLGLIAILGLEQATGMLHSARPTGALLAGLLSAAILTDLLMGPRAWCKHLCPLGKLVSLGARISLVEMQSNANICTSRCRVDECIKTRECPMGLHPTALAGAERCILCFSCVRHCPHQSIRLDLRSPLQGLVSRPARNLGESLGATAFTGAALASQLSPWMQTLGAPLPPAPAFAATTGAYILLAAACSACKGWMLHFQRLGPAHLPLGFAVLFHLYFSEFVHRGENLAPLWIQTLGLDRWLDPADFIPELGTLRALLPLCLLLGTGLSLRLAHRLHPQGGGRLGGVLHQALMVATCLLLLVLR